MSEPIQAEPAAAQPPRKQGFFSRLRLRVAALSRSPHAHAAMLGVAVIDGSVFPVPPFAILVPMVLAEPKRWLRYATTGTLASLVGGLIGYGLGIVFGLALAEWLGVDLGFKLEESRKFMMGAEALVAAAGWLSGSFGASLASGFAYLQGMTLAEMLSSNFWVLALLCSVLPTPYKVVAIGSGLVGVDLVAFLLASVIGRTARFFGVAGAFAFFGEKARRYIRV